MVQMNSLKIAAVYFSQEGHTKKVLERFVDKFQSFGHEIEKINITETDIFDFMSYYN